MNFTDLVHDDEYYVSTCSGQRLYLLAPSASQINIDDIAQGLACQPCYCGQTSQFYSLAQHSVLVAGLVPAQQRLAALLHDAVSAYLGNLPRSMHQLLPGYALIEARVVAAIRECFALSSVDEAMIRRAHLIVQATERRDVRPQVAEFRRLDGIAAVPRRIECLAPEDARREFKALFNRLVKTMSSWKQEANPGGEGEAEPAERLPRRREAGEIRPRGKRLRSETVPTTNH